MTEDRLRELLREMRDEPLPADSLARVREGVAARIESKRGGMWKWGGALIAAALLAAVWLWPNAEIPAPPAAPIVAVPQPEPVVPPPVPKPRIVSKARPQKPAPEPEVVFRIQTEDPEVVIWLSN